MAPRFFFLSFPCFAGSFVTAHGLFLVASSRLLLWDRGSKHVGPVVAVHGLSSPAAGGILLPQPGIKLAYPALEGKFLTTGQLGKSLEQILNVCLHHSYL